MTKVFLIREIQDKLLSYQALISFFLLIVLFIINGLVSSSRYNSYLEYYNQFHQKNVDELTTSSESLHSLVFLDQEFILPPSKYLLAADYNEAQIPNAIKLNYFEKDIPYSSFEQNPLLGNIFSLDWNNIMIYIISLIALIFSYNSFSGEKSNGTFKLVFSNDVSKRTVLLGKICGNFILIVIPVFLGFCLSIIIFKINSAISLDGVFFARIALYFLLASFFILFNIALGLLFSSVSSKPIISLSYSILTWVAFVLLLPNSIWTLSKLIEPVDSYSDVLSKKQEVLKEALKNNAEGGNWSYNWLGKPPGNEVLKVYDYYTEVANANNQIVNKYTDDLFKQYNLAATLSSLSPFSHFKLLGGGISNNGVYRYKDFYRRVSQYFNTYKDFVKSADNNDKNSYHLIWKVDWQTQSFMSNAGVDYKSIPIFEYKDPTLKETISSFALNIMYLLCWIIVTLVAVFILFLKYDIR